MLPSTPAPADNEVERVLQLLSRLMNQTGDQALQELQTMYPPYPSLEEVVDSITALRQATSALRRGQLEEPIIANGFIAANLKSVQANLNHLVWQMSQVSKGDFSQRIDFLGDFSDTFNAMCERLGAIHQHLEELAYEDGLTKLANRFFLDQYLGGLFAKAKDSGAVFTIMMIDIDFFKKVNDSYGHDVGDRVLVQIAKYLTDIFRTADFIARYGGEEFIAVLPRTDLAQAGILAARLQEQFRSSPICVTNELKIPITVSIGMSQLKPDDTNAEQLIKRSDMALYQAKNNGRNRTEVYMD